MSDENLAQPVVEEVPEPTTEEVVAEVLPDEGVKNTPVEEIVEAEPVVEEADPQERPDDPEKEDKGYTLRSTETGDKVFLVKDGKRHWIMNPQTLERLGFNLGDEKHVSYNELSEFEEGKALNLLGSTPSTPEKTEPKLDDKKEESGAPYKIYS